MASASMQLDPNATAYTDDEIVGKVNAASANISRASSVDAAARPIVAGEVTEAELGDGAVTDPKMAETAAKDNLDALGDTDRGYVKTAPAVGECPVIAVQRAADGKLDVDYDDVPIE